MNPTPKRISAAVLSLALGFSAVGAPVLAPMASAQTIEIEAGDVSTVDLGADVSLTINKYEGEIGDITTPLADTTFTVAKVDLGGAALNTVAGWTEVNTIQAALEAGTTPTLAGGSWDLTTDVNGTATISTNATTDVVVDNESVDPNFTVGLYLVTEKQNGNFSMGKPFLVALPFTDSSGQWKYRQVVQPKNQALSVEKDVTDLGATLGETVNYTIRASVPADELDRFNIIDALPAELDLDTNTAITVTAINATPAVPLTEGAAADYTIDTTGDVITIEFTNDGLGKLETARENNPDLQVQVTLGATIVALPANGVIRNDVVVELPNDGRITTDPDDPDNPGEREDGAETRLGTLTINKQDAAGNPIEITDDGDVTRGASFELWRCEETTAGSGTWAVSEGPLSAVVDDGEGNDTVVATFVTDAAGVASLTGVQIKDWVNNGAPADSGVAPDLCVVETEAPNGYVLNPEPQQVNFDTDTPNEFDMVVDVMNLDDTIDGQLPSTGGMGTMAMIAAGLLVAVSGGFAALRGNRARG